MANVDPSQNAFILASIALPSLLASMSPPCRHFNRPGGCKFGNSCRFSHDVATSRPNPQPLSNRETPPGVCRSYWTHGDCKFEFNCKFRHQAGPGVLESSPSPSPARSSAKDSGIVPFLTEKGLAKLSGSGTDGFFPSNSATRTPADTHNGLKRFLQNDYRFSLTTDVYSFLTLLSSASTTNLTWVSVYHPCHSSVYTQGYVVSGGWSGQ